MNPSFKFFENKDCQYYPCHKHADEINCLFCYCPLYSIENCPGSYQYIIHDGKQIKDCTDCTFPHQPENYDIIVAFLAKR